MDFQCTIQMKRMLMLLKASEIPTVVNCVSRDICDWFLVVVSPQFIG
jgi:hypothetical protein